MVPHYSKSDLPLTYVHIFSQRGDTIDIIAMNPSGLWRGRSQGRIGHFKFINVELLPERHAGLRSEHRKRSVTSQRMQNNQDGPPKTVEDLLKRIGLEVCNTYLTKYKRKKHVRKIIFHMCDHCYY